MLKKRQALAGAQVGTAFCDWARLARRGLTGTWASVLINYRCSYTGGGTAVRNTKLVNSVRRAQWNPSAHRRVLLLNLTCCRQRQTSGNGLRLRRGEDDPTRILQDMPPWILGYLGS